MNAGDLRHRINIYTREQIEETDGSGVFTKLTEIAILWAMIKPVSGLTRIDSKQIGEEVTHIITIRYFPLISSEHWLKLDKRNFEIKTVKNIDERNQYLELTVKEVFTNSSQQTPLVAGGSVGDPL